METASENTSKNPDVNGENSGNTNITLPEEIIIDIISRLPVKQVFQLQCLSKNFVSITNDLNFIYAHLGLSARLYPSIILNKGNDVYLIQSNGIDSKTIAEEVPLHRIIDLTNSTEMLKIKASCNGLVILSVGDRDCFIWNPATIQCNRLPNPHYVDGMHFGSAEWGFGYCPKSSQYKIVRTAYYFDGPVWCSGEMVAEVLSYGTDCKWRRLDFGNYVALCNGPGITVKGTVYWTMFNVGRLLSFDLEKEEFSWMTCSFGRCENIMEFQGSLAACTRQTSKLIFEIWVLKDSWEIICCIKDIYPYSPIRFLNDHQLLLVHEDEDSAECSWSLYDLEREEIKRTIQAFGSNSSVVFDFVQSVVPLLP